MATRIQGASTTDMSGTGYTSLAVTLSAVSSGNLVCGYVACSNGTTVTVADNQSNTYSVITTGGDDTANSEMCVMFYKENITNAPTTITATFSGTRQYVSIGAEEFSGIATTSALTGTPTMNVQGTPGTGTNALTSTNTTPAVNGSLIWGFSLNDSGNLRTPSSGTGYTAGITDNAAPSKTEYQTQTTAAAIAATFTVGSGGGSDSHITGVMAFKPVAGGSPYTLTASSGAFTETGIAAALKADRFITGGVGNYTLTGIDATLVYSSIPTNYTLTAQLGQFSLNGQDATTTYSVLNTLTWDRVSGNEGYRIEWGQTSSGPYPNTADNAVDDETYDLVLPYRTTWYARIAALIAGVPQTYSSEIAFTSGIGDLNADVSSYTLTGIDVNLGIGRKTTGGVGTFTLTGTTAGLGVARSVAADTASFTLTGTSATLSYSGASSTYTLTASSAAFDLSGVDVGTTKGYSLPVDVSSFIVNGINNGLIYSGNVSSATLMHILATRLGLSL